MPARTPLRWPQPGANSACRPWLERSGAEVAALAVEAPGALPPHPGENLPPAGRHKILGEVNMKPGDKVEVEITGLGVLANSVIADAEVAYRSG